MKIKHTSDNNSRGTSCFTRMMDCFHKFFRIYNFDKDRRRNTTILLLTLIASAILATIQVILAIVVDLRHAMYKFLINVPFLGVALVCIGTVILFRYTHAYQITGHVSLIIGMAALFGLNYFLPGKNGIVSSNLVLNWSLPILVVFFVLELKLRFFVAVGFLLCIIGLFILEYVKGVTYNYTARSEGLPVYLNWTVPNMIGVVVIIVYAIQLRKQIELAEKVSNAIANLDLEGEVVVKLLNTEDRNLSSLDLSLKKIVANMKEYKPYLPQSFLSKDEEVSEEETPKPSIKKEIAKSTQSTGKRSASSAISSRSSMTSVQSATHKERVGVRTTEGLNWKNATFMVVNIKDFNELAKKLSPKDLTRVHAAYLSLIDKQVSATRGVCHGFYGDKLFCSWNAACICFEHECRACTAALQIVNTLNSVTNPKLKEDGFDGLEIRIGISSGKVLSGNIGIDTLKSFTNIGNAVNLAFSLEQMNKSYSTNILIDQNVQEKAKYRFVTRIIDHISTKSHKRPLLIYEVLNKIEIEADEWLYELQQSEKHSAMDKYNEAWNQLLEGNFVGAEALVCEHLKDSKDDQHALRLFDIIKKQNKSYVNTFP